MKKKWRQWLRAAALCLTALCGTQAISYAAEAPSAPTFDVERFVLPDEARVLIVVEGAGDSSCRVYAYEYAEAEAGADTETTAAGKTAAGETAAGETAAGETAAEETAAETGRDTGMAPDAGGKAETGWQLRLETDGLMGRNGMNNCRVEGDKTTPVGLFEMNTPFGQADALPGFPENYIQVSGRRYVWTQATNRLAEDWNAYGERVGTSGYAGYYDYAIDMGFNRNAVPGKGAALFLHCIKSGRTDTSGCVAVAKEQMAEIMKLYGAYGDGHVFIALAPAGTFELIYDSLGTGNGLSPAGDFTANNK